MKEGARGGTMGGKYPLTTRTCMEYHPVHERTPTRVRRAGTFQRFSHDICGVSTPLPEQRCVLGVSEGAVLSERDGVPEVPQGFALPSDLGTFGVLLPVLRPSRLPDCWHDFSQVVHFAPVVVLGDLSNFEQQVRDLGEAARARDW